MNLYPPASDGFDGGGPPDRGCLWALALALAAAALLLAAALWG